MGIVNRRNAMLGWAAWKIGKRIARRKARGAVPAVDIESKRPNKAAVVAAVATFLGALWLWRRSAEDDSDVPE